MVPNQQGTAPPFSPIRAPEAKRSDSEGSKIEDVQVLSQSDSSANAPPNITLLSEDYSSSSPHREKVQDPKPEKSEVTGAQPIDSLSDIPVQERTNQPSSFGMISVKTDDSIRDVPAPEAQPAQPEENAPEKVVAEEADVNIDVSDSSSCDF